MAQKFIGVTLPIRLGQTGMFEQSTSLIEQTRSNFKNLILTKKGERVGQANLGCDLWKILFEQITEETLENARTAVINAVNAWIPYIELVDMRITPSDNINYLDVRCLYRFKSNPSITDEVVTRFRTAFAAGVKPFPTEPTTASALTEYQQQVANMRQIRRAEMRAAR